jgi:hypothetical protein
MEKVVNKTLQWLLKRTNHLNDLFTDKIFDKIVQQGHEKGDERKGLLLLFIKAFEVVKNDHYRRIVEKELIKYPAYLVKNDLTQDTGLAGLGELYLEAWRVFDNPEWRTRVDWLAQVYVHTFYFMPGDTGYWMIEERNDPRADFMTGNSGIIHFLLRSMESRQIGYRFFE